jgi:hypothetical protein
MPTKLKVQPCDLFTVIEKADLSGNCIRCSTTGILRAVGISGILGIKCSFPLNLIVSLINYMYADLDQQ